MVRPVLQTQTQDAGRRGGGCCPRVARNNQADGPPVQRPWVLGVRLLSDSDSSLERSDERPPGSVRRLCSASIQCALCNIACLFLADIGTQTDSAVMTCSRIGCCHRHRMRRCLRGASSKVAVYEPPLSVHRRRRTRPGWPGSPGRWTGGEKTLICLLAPKAQADDHEGRPKPRSLSL